MQSVPRAPGTGGTRDGIGSDRARGWRTYHGSSVEAVEYGAYVAPLAPAKWVSRSAPRDWDRRTEQGEVEWSLSGCDVRVFLWFRSGRLIN